MTPPVPEADEDHERREHPVEEDRDRRPLDEEAREHRAEVNPAEPQPVHREEPVRLNEEAAAAREVEADPRHEGDDEELRGEEHGVGHQTRVPALHGRQPGYAEVRDQRLSQDSRCEQPEEQPEKRCAQVTSKTHFSGKYMRL